jgi:hypothetical protein
MTDFKRLTNEDYKDLGIVGYDGGLNPCKVMVTIGELIGGCVKGGSREIMTEVFTRLAAYEDTNLTTAQIHALQTRNDELTAMLGEALEDARGHCMTCMYSDLSENDPPCSECHPVSNRHGKCNWQWKGCIRYNVPEFPAKGE